MENLATLILNHINNALSDDGDWTYFIISMVFSAMIIELVA